MGLSFHNKSSMVEASIGSLHFVPDIPNPMPENGVVDEERIHDNFQIQLSDELDIQMVDRWIVEKEKTTYIVTFSIFIIFLSWSIYRSSGSDDRHVLFSIPYIF